MTKPQFKESIQFEQAVTQEPFLPVLCSDTDLLDELKRRQDVLFSLEEKVSDIVLEKKTVKDIKKLEAEIAKGKKHALILSKALNNGFWSNTTISDEAQKEGMHESCRLMKEFKALEKEVREERKQKQNERRFNLTETNAAMALAPFATYGFLNLFFPDKPVVSKSAALVVFSVEMVYVVYKNNPDHWHMAGKEITVKGLTQASKWSPKNVKTSFAKVHAKIKVRGDALLQRAVDSRPIRKIKKMIGRNKNDNKLS